MKCPSCGRWQDRWDSPLYEVGPWLPCAWTDCEASPPARVNVFEFFGSPVEPLRQAIFIRAFERDPDGRLVKCFWKESPTLEGVAQARPPLLRSDHAHEPERRPVVPFNPEED